MHNLSDARLMALLQEGDQAAFREIYERYWSVLYLHARRMLGQEEDARDIVQELFVRLWEQPVTLAGEVPLSAYLYRAIRNRVFNYWEHRRVANDYLRSLNAFLEEGTVTADELLREKELAALIESEISQLPARMREVFELSRKQHLSYQEIALTLEISEHTVKRQVSNALKILRMKLGYSSLLLLFLMR